MPARPRPRTTLTPGLVPGVFVWAWIAVWPAASAQAACQPPAALEPVVVAAVVDGDTVRLADGRRIRLVGVNTPELGHGRRPDEPLAEAARAALDAMLGPDRRLWLAPGRDARDHHGRGLAHAFLGPRGDSVEERLLRAGLGWHVVVPPNLALAECLAQAERSALRTNVGVWSEPVLAARQADRLTAADAGFRRVSGRVTKVDETRHSWWLELNGPLVLRVDKRDLDHWGGEAVIRGLKGKAVIVRGWIVDRSARTAADRKPLLLPLRHRAMLEAPRLAPQ